MADVEPVPLAEVPKVVEDQDLGDFWPGLVLGISATFSTVWWIVSWFVYIKNTPGDDLLMNKSNTATSPIGFFWERINETNGVYIYMALS